MFADRLLLLCGDKMGCVAMWEIGLGFNFTQWNTGNLFSLLHTKHQMFEYDGSAMLFWYALAESPSPETADQSNFGRGITGLSDNLICVGTQQGHILVFSIPAKGTNVTLIDTLKVHKCAIADLASEGSNLVSSDEDGNIITWKYDQSMSQLAKIPGTGDPCSSLAMWKGVIVGAFGSGQIKLFDCASGKISACVNAHARWINALDIAKTSGLLVSASEDTFVKVWQIIPGGNPCIDYIYGESVTDLQLVGAKFIQDSGKGFCVTGIGLKGTAVQLEILDCSLEVADDNQN